MNAIQTFLTDSLDIWSTAETEKKSGRGRASGNAASVYGIRKLRELILELAVRGKLVPQDANDEPASALLKRIQAEKAKLISEGTIKKDKLFTPIADEEKPFLLPQGWAYARLGDAVEIIRGITFPGSEKSKAPENGRVACLRTTNVQDQIEWDDLLYIGEKFVSREDQFLMPRDIVMSMANSRELVGKVALVGEKIHQKTSFGGFLGVLRPFLIEPRFVMTLLRTPHTREALIDSASQTTNIANISLAKLRPLFFAIPPLAEQHRIVAKVDELMALCDQLETQHSNAADAHEKLVSHLLATLAQSQNAEDFAACWQCIAAHFDTLFATEASIDALKQTLLQLAVMGKLVPQDANDEPARELLKRIQTEKAKFVAEGKIKKDKPLAAITEDKIPYKLPQSWRWVRFDHIAENSKHALKAGPFGSALKKDMYCESGYKIYGQEQVISGDEKFGDYYVDEKKFQQLSSCAVKPGDILISLVGTIGRVLALSEDCEFGIINPRLVKISLFKEINRSYIKVIFTSPHLRYEMANQSHGGTMNILNLGLLRELALPLPPIAEQHRIVAKVDELMALCDKLKSRITDAGRLQQKLADVLVEKATE